MWADDLLNDIQHAVLLNPDLFCLSPVIRDGVSVPCGILLTRKGWCSVHRRVHPFSQEMYLRLWLKQPEQEKERMHAVMARAEQIAGALSKRYQIGVDAGWVASLLIEFGLEPRHIA